ncbi:hypothetical protein DMC01_12385 [Campylobacter troglodytis]|nr:hypothetical protein DMC01_12385 [Campylobacter troglodytis]
MENKYKLPKDKGGAYLAKDNKQIKEIWEDLIKEAIFLADVLDEQGEYMIKRARLKDGTVVKLRKKSKSGGSTIEVDKNKLRNIDKKKDEQIKIHNKEKEDGDW